MEVTTAGLWLAPLVALAVVFLLAIVHVALRGREPERPVSESLLLACIVTPLILLLELYTLTRLPVNRPLRLLPIYHALITAGLLALVLRRYGLAAWRESFVRVVRGIFNTLRESGPLVALALLALPVLMWAIFRFGAYTTPNTWDEMEVHVPIAVQPYQDGQLGIMTSCQPMLATYPRGTALLWFWTLQMTHTDLLFHATQGAFGLVLLLAFWVLARRSQVPAWAAGVGVVVIATTPLFSILTTIGYVDIPHVAVVTTMLAFLSPPRDPAWKPTRDWLPAALAFALSCEIKYPILPFLFGGLVIVQTVFFRGRCLETLRAALRFVVSERGLASFLIVAASCHLYINHWIHHRNPFYALSLTVAGRNIFPGPMDGKMMDNAGSSSIKPVAKMSKTEKYFYSWTDFNEPLTAESFGSFGPVLPFGLLLPAAACVLLALFERQTWRLTLAVMILFCIVLTPSHVPRYGLTMFVLIVLCAGLWLSQWPGRARYVYAAIILAMCYPGLRTGLDRFDLWYNILHRFTGGHNWKLRGSPLLEHYDLGPPWGAAPALVRLMRERCGPGDHLVFNIRTFPTKFFNRNWSNHIQHLPGSPRELWPNKVWECPPPTPGELEVWVRRLAELHPDHVLVYAHSAYAGYLRAHAELGYGVIYEDGPERGQYPLVFFERGAPTAKPPATAPATTQPATTPAPASPVDG